MHELDKIATSPSLEKGVLYRSVLHVAVCARWFWQAGKPEWVPNASGSWPAEPERLQVGRPGACNDDLMGLFVPFVRR